MDKQDEILATLRSIEVMLAKQVAISSVQVELAGIHMQALPNIDAAALTKGITDAMKKIEKIGR